VQSRLSPKKSRRHVVNALFWAAAEDVEVAKSRLAAVLADPALRMEHLVAEVARCAQRDGEVAAGGADAAATEMLGQLLKRDSAAFKVRRGNGRVCPIWDCTDAAS
jgi:hypothetical protein